MRITTKRINEIGGEIFGGGFFHEGLFVVFDDDFEIVDLNNFTPVDGEFGVHEGFESGALNDDLLGGESFAINNETDDFAKVGAALAFNFEINEVKIE